MRLKVDAHTAHHLFHECLKGELMRGRTLILVSHHVQLCVPGASYIVALDNGRATFAGTHEEFKASGVMSGLVQSDNAQQGDETAVQDSDLQLVDKAASKKASPLLTPSEDIDPNSDSSSTAAASFEADGKSTEKTTPRKLIEEETRAVGRISKDIWVTYTKACGGSFYWVLFSTSMLIATLSPVIENTWLRLVTGIVLPPAILMMRSSSMWSRDAQTGKDAKGPVYYITIYTIVRLHLNIIKCHRSFQGIVCV